MDRDPRVEELTNLRLALATFALQLDAFEARLKGRSPKTTLKAFHPAPPDISVANKILAAMKERPRNRDSSLHLPKVNYLWSEIDSTRCGKMQGNCPTGSHISL